ncbi:MAG: hypothetical protein KAS04_00590, partial [Candidatus Aenigmarchaeota archaeon]|nr:hypothetical protein [Candidatus Aenigmarchaeota archaeon]
TDEHTWNVTVIDVPQGVFASAPPSGPTSAQQCEEDWRCDEWSVCPTYEIQSRECNDINKCGTDFYKPEETRDCVYVAKPSCEDGVQNCHDGSCEIWIDCGGPCSACSTCSDGIKNCHTTKRGVMICEDDIDCGGPCPECPEGGVPTVCGNGVCEDGELLLCIPDCGLFFGEFLLMIIILGAGSILLYRTYAILLIAYRKRKPLPYTNMQLLGTETLRKLHLIQLEMGKKSVGKILTEFSSVMREFFAKRFNMKKKFTYIELSEISRRKKIGTKLADTIGGFAVKMTEIEYRHIEPSVTDVSSVIKNAITIVERLTGTKMQDTFEKRADMEMEKLKPKEKVELKSDKLEAKPVKKKTYRMGEKDKKDIETVTKLIEKAEKSLANHNINETEETYTKIREIYDNMQPEVKNKLYDETIRIIKLYNQIMRELNKG